MSLGRLRGWAGVAAFALMAVVALASVPRPAAAQEGAGPAIEARVAARALPDGRVEVVLQARQGAEEGVDVLVCHPRLVQTALDLVESPTIVWAETESSVLQSAPNPAVFVGSEFAPWPRRSTLLDPWFLSNGVE